MKLSIDSIRRDGGTQPRAAIHYHTVNEYQDEIEAGFVFPPVDVFFDGTTYWLVDGFHRAEATYGAGLDEIEATIHQGTLDDAKWFSFGANRGHGLRRTNDDKQRAVKSALAHPNAAEMSDRAIADHIGMSPQTVNTWRSQVSKLDTSTKRTGKDGKKYPAQQTPRQAARRPQQTKEVVVNPGPNYDDGGGDIMVPVPPTTQPEESGPTNTEFWINVQAGTLVESARTIADCPLTSAEILGYLKERGLETDLDAIARCYEFLGTIIEQTQG